MKTLVLGAAVSGKAAARLARRLGHEVDVYDATAAAVAQLRDESFAVHSGVWSPTLLRDVDAVVTSPGIPEHATPIVDVLASGITLWSELEFATRHLESPYVAVTGTNGKTTTVEATNAILTSAGKRSCAVGNIGTAVSDIVATNEPAFEAVVVEASSFQLRFTDTFHPRAAAILNVAPDHLDWHGSFEAYASAKARIHRNMTPSDLIVFDAEDAGAVEAVAGTSARSLAVSGTHLPPGGWGRVGDSLVLADDRIPAPALAGGLVMDLVTAAALASHLGADIEATSDVVSQFAAGAHRHRTVGIWDEVTWIDDSKATNPHAAAAAARSHDSVVLIAGGRNKGLDLSPIAAVPSIAHIVALGEASNDIWNSAPERTILVDTLAEAVETADKLAEPGDTVLLAPGCASFDMFDSYEQRGDEFTRLVRTAKGEI